MPTSLPEPGARRLAVQVTPDALRHVRSGHPWVFADSIEHDDRQRDAAPGDLAVIFDRKRAFAAIGLWDPTSPIRIKVLHSGAPRQIDSTFWHERVAAALQRRGGLLADGSTTGFRWINGENDGLPGVIIDRYADTAVLKLYTAAWFPHLRALVTAIDTVGHPARLVLRWARSLGEGPHFGISEGDALLGTAPTDAVMFRENGLWFEADVIRGQKTGHFLDQRDNRALVMRHCQGASVLDVFASTGGFSVYAAAGGATDVTSVDSSTPTLAAASRNMRHNNGLPDVQRCRYESIVDDAYAAMERLARQQRSFDVVVVDPPSFAHRQSDIDMALRAYARLTTLAVRLVRPGGLLFQASCSSRVSADAFRATVRAAAQREGFDLVRMRSTGHGVDHPVTFTEGEYLKALVATVQRLPQSAM